jgi:hypothetical protein
MDDATGSRYVCRTTSPWKTDGLAIRNGDELNQLIHGPTKRKLMGGLKPFLGGSVYRAGESVTAHHHGGIPYMVEDGAGPWFALRNVGLRLLATWLEDGGRTHKGRRWHRLQSLQARVHEAPHVLAIPLTWRSIGGKEGRLKPQIIVYMEIINTG